ncbi:DUF2235 domain-containing protein [Roseococcus sp. YIM B11640]|uniref:DUF2235 domain-containing protein n=1 Tax=Roseococcus sp. YIM B11640 TaxID=3133973 RepID=UPI003C7A4E6B
MSEEAVGVPRRRNIVLFSDGTGNSVNSIFRTNVRRLYDALDLEDTEPTKYPRQFAFYDDGVGTSSFRPLAMLGGAFGFGLARNVREIYAFLCRTWRPGDEIYGFGFSRGAFTMRVVMGLVMNQGIVRYDGSEANLQRQVNEAWRAYRRERYRGRVLTEIARPVRDAVIWAKNALLGVPSYDPKANSGGPGEPDQRTEVRFLGCFDTVDAYGLPIAELTRAMDAVVYPVTMPDADLNERVKRACQALSLDDERSTFYPRLWNEAKEPPAGEDIGRERISQVWFAGMHSDVGGGYADDGLAHTPLIWMLEQAEAAGLRFAPAVKDLFRAVADEHGPIHDSRRGFASYFRYKPRRLDAILHQSRAQSGRPDVEVARPKIHESVFNRIKAGQDGYAPISLPADFDVLKANGSLVTADQFLGPGLWNGSAAARERVWNWVWWRRVAYFWTLASTLALAGAPFLLKPTGCESWACFLKPVIEAGSGVLPAMLAQPFSVYGSHPVTLLVLAACLMAGILAGRWLDTRVPDEMRCVWYDLGPVTTPVRPAKGGLCGAQARGAGEPRRAGPPALRRLSPAGPRGAAMGAALGGGAGRHLAYGRAAEPVGARRHAGQRQLLHDARECLPRHAQRPKRCRLAFRHAEHLPPDARSDGAGRDLPAAHTARRYTGLARCAARLEGRLAARGPAWAQRGRGGLENRAPDGRRHSPAPPRHPGLVPADGADRRDRRRGLRLGLAPASRRPYL